MRLAILIALTLASAGLYAKAGAAGTSTIAFPDCLGHPVIKPATVMLACGDGNFRIEHIQWTGWGASFAAGRGTGVLNDCVPNCAGGHFHSYPMLLIVTGRQTCPSGQPAYDNVVYAFIGHSPMPQANAADAEQHFPCKPIS